MLQAVVNFLSCSRGPGKRGHIVAETLLFMTFPCVRKLGNICCGHKMFLNKILNVFCVPDTNFVSAIACNAGVFWRARLRVWSSERHLGFKLGRGLERNKNVSQGEGVRLLPFSPAPSPPTLLKPIWRRIYDRELQNENACTAGEV